MRSIGYDPAYRRMPRRQGVRKRLLGGPVDKLN
jgi:hypothetical protein